MILILVWRPYVADILWSPAAHSSMVTRTAISRGIFYVDCFGPSAFMEPTMLAMMVGRAGPQTSWL